MEFNKLIEDFATRHKVGDLVAVDGAAALDIDGIIVTIVSNDGSLTFSAEIGERPSEGAALFADLLLSDFRPAAKAAAERAASENPSFGTNGFMQV